MKKFRNLFLLVAILLPCVAAYGQKVPGDFYQVKIYHLKNNDQVEQVDGYLKDVYLPALHRAAIKNIGVFKPLANDTAVIKFIYILIPFNSPEAWAKLDRILMKDAV